MIKILSYSEAKEWLDSNSNHSLNPTSKDAKDIKSLDFIPQNKHQLSNYIRIIRDLESGFSTKIIHLETLVLIENILNGRGRYIIQNDELHLYNLTDYTESLRKYYR